MAQAADRRQLGATSTPPSLPAPGWRRDSVQDRPGSGIKQAPEGAFCVDIPPISLRPPDRPALVLVLAPLLGFAVWAALAGVLFRLIS